MKSLSKIHSDACTAAGMACKPNGECVNSDLAVDGWFCHCFDGYVADTDNDQQACVPGKQPPLVTDRFLYIIMIGLL